MSNAPSSSEPATAPSIRPSREHRPRSLAGIFIGTRDEVCSCCAREIKAPQLFAILVPDNVPVCTKCAKLGRRLLVPVGDPALTRRVKRFDHRSQTVWNRGQLKEQSIRLGVWVTRQALHDAWADLADPRNTQKKSRKFFWTRDHRKDEYLKAQVGRLGPMSWDQRQQALIEIAKARSTPSRLWLRVEDVVRACNAQGIPATAPRRRPDGVWATPAETPSVDKKDVEKDDNHARKLQLFNGLEDAYNAAMGCPKGPGNSTGTDADWLLPSSASKPKRRTRTLSIKISTLLRDTSRRLQRMRRDAALERTRKCERLTLEERAEFDALLREYAILSASGGADMPAKTKAAKPRSESIEDLLTEVDSLLPPSPLAFTS